MSFKLSGLNSLAYVGVQPTTPPQLLYVHRRPTVNDFININVGTLWLFVGQPGNTPIELYMAATVFPNNATWILLYPQGNAATGVITTIYNTPGSFTWIKNANTQVVEVIGFNAGSGGGSGRRGASGAAGGGAGGGPMGGFRYRSPASFFGATETVVIGAGGVGGAPVTVDNTNGNPGSTGSISTFGVLNVGAQYPANSGGGGINGNSQSGPGLIYTDMFPVSFAGASFLAPSPITSATILTSGLGTTTNGLAGANLGVQYTSGSSYTGGQGGGGGGANAGGGGTGGAGSQMISQGGNTFTVAIAGAAGGAAEGNGSNGLGPVTSGGIVSGGMGGGGGGGMTAVAAGAGGIGAAPGGSGGGGGGSINGTNSGAGGNGAAGMVIVIEFL